MFEPRFAIPPLEGSRTGGPHLGLPGARWSFHRKQNAASPQPYQPFWIPRNAAERFNRAEKVAWYIIYIYVPVWVLMCRLSSDGRSKALRHTSHGNKVRSPRNGLGFTGVVLHTIMLTLWSSDAVSPDSELADDDSPDSDLRSSVLSRPLGGDDAEDADDVPNALDNNDMDRSNGESAETKMVLRISCNFVEHFFLGIFNVKIDSNYNFEIQVNKFLIFLVSNFLFASTQKNKITRCEIYNILKLYKLNKFKRHIFSPLFKCIELPPMMCIHTNL